MIAESPVEGRRLGRLPARWSLKSLMFADFLKFMKLPTSVTYWQKKTPLPLRTYGNDSVGNCTVATQAVAATRMERLEQRRLIEITDAEMIRVYVEMSNRLYGGGDNGAYVSDSLDNWRREDLTFRDTSGKPYTIDAYLKVNPANLDEIRTALALSGARGIAVGLNLPLAFRDLDPPNQWAIPAGQRLTGEWMPGSWGGHEMWGNGYAKAGVILDHTWGLPNQLITWEAWATYVDECYVVVDSINAWRKRLRGSTVARLNLGGVREAVNAVSSVRI